MKRITTESAPPPIGPYSQAIQVNGFLFTAGQIGMDANGELADGLEDQTRQVIQNLSAVLEAGDSSLASVVKTTIYLADMGDFQSVNTIYEEYFGVSQPARSAVEAARLPKDALVEIEAIAVLNDSSAVSP